MEKQLLESKVEDTLLMYEELFGDVPTNHDLIGSYIKKGK